jgi:hypothetical protein
VEVIPVSQELQSERDIRHIEKATYERRIEALERLVICSLLRGERGVQMSYRGFKVTDEWLASVDWSKYVFHMLRDEVRGVVNVWVEEKE